MVFLKDKNLDMLRYNVPTLCTEVAAYVRIRNDVEEHYYGTMSEQCVFCGVVYWKKLKNTAHKYTKRCHDGKVQLPVFSDVLEPLKALLTENSPVKLSKLA
ncbi:hypothetical protein AVEN_234842-1 [Araneus ventricosus]|uniref:Uncharacterized protein n=1 Tax=Araneus ventricosus TaxID=182803 RepID=A0A4Y2F7N7_ARAVE|nr:hypothetical protein AVEN_234842-1 [Araneus ventricosus]